MPTRFEAEQLFERIRHRWGRCISELIRIKKHLSKFNAYLYVIGSSGPYGVLTASFGRLRTEWASAARRSP
jgi:hypothetical protein